jgi:hypothetical protein
VGKGQQYLKDIRNRNTDSAQKNTKHTFLVIIRELKRLDKGLKNGKKLNAHNKNTFRPSKTSKKK